MTLNSWLIGLICAALIFCAGCLSGSWYETRDAQQVAAEQLRKAFEQGQELGTVREVVVTKYVESVQVVKEKAKTIIQKVPVYVSKESDARCAVPAGFVRLHDAAAANVPPVASPASVPNDSPSGIALSAVAGTVADNYESAHLNAEQLKALQQWARDSHAIANGNAPGKN